MDIYLDWDESTLIVKAQTNLGREVVKSLLGRSEAHLPWSEARPFIRSLEAAVELHNVTVGGSRPQ